MYKFFLLFIVFIFLGACQAAKDGLTQKKRSNADEFLVEKKNPLELPPDFDDLPVPLEQGEEENIQANNEQDIKNILEIDTNEENSQETNSQSLEQLILEKIN